MSHFDLTVDQAAPLMMAASRITDEAERRAEVKRILSQVYSRGYSEGWDAGYAEGWDSSVGS